MKQYPITLANLADASEEAIFNQIAEHLLTQNARCTDEQGRCAYRGGDENTLACAAGCLISNEEYLRLAEMRRSIDSSNLLRTSWLGLVAEKAVPENGQYVIRELQTLHDLFPPSEWPRLLIKQADIEGFTLNEAVRTLLEDHLPAEPSA